MEGTQGGMIERPACLQTGSEGWSWCSCCGEFAAIGYGVASVQGWEGGSMGSQGRCQKHIDRNPCAISGCRRTTSSEHIGYALDQWICGEHWRAYVPPRSLERRVYHRFFRQAKRHGWTDELELRYWRFWSCLVARARRRADDGHVNIEEINRIMGW